MTKSLGLLLLFLAPATLAGNATIYYHLPYKGWSAAYIHHNAQGTWTEEPGEAMTAACEDWVKKTVPLPVKSSYFLAALSDGYGHWDNLHKQPGANYVVPAGTHQIKNGKLLEHTGSPCPATSPKPLPHKKPKP